MKLHIIERLYILQMLPEQNEFMDFALKKSILNKVGITPEEKETYNIVEKPEEGKIVWDTQKDFENPIEIEFTTDELKYIRKGCEALTNSSAPMPDGFWLTMEKLYDSSKN